jgi:drug/metabolite transporter (DMT)-like permease
MLPGNKMRPHLSVKPTLLPPSPATVRTRIENGMILMASSAFMAPIGHAIAKSLGATMTSGQTAWARFFFQVAFLLPVIAVAHRGRIPGPSLAHGLRGLLLAATTLSFFSSLAYMPLANCAAIFYVEPLLLTVVSALFLGERTGWRRITAVAIGFLGTLIVIRPSYNAVGLPALLPLVAASCFAAYVVITRQQADTETALPTQFWICVFSVAALSLAMALGQNAAPGVLGASWPTLWQWVMLAAIGAVALIVQRLALLAIHMTPASILAPLQYAEILGSIILGAIVFGDVPDALTSLGTAIIIGSGLYVFRREQLLARRASRR